MYTGRDCSSITARTRSISWAAVDASFSTAVATVMCSAIFSYILVRCKHEGVSEGQFHCDSLETAVSQRMVHYCLGIDCTSGWISNDMNNGDIFAVVPCHSAVGR